MKRVKALVASAAVVAVVAGAVAFKAPTGTQFFRLNPSTGNCNQAFLGTIDPTAAQISYNTQASNGACPLVARIKIPQ